MSTPDFIDMRGALRKVCVFTSRLRRSPTICVVVWAPSAIRHAAWILTLRGSPASSTMACSASRTNWSRE